MKNVSDGVMNESGVRAIQSQFSFVDTVQRLLDTFEGKGLRVFTVIDQQAEARNAGMQMPPTTLILFGNPKAGTPLMVDNPASGIDLPLKVLVSEATAGEVMVYLNASEYLINRHALEETYLDNLGPAEQLIAGVLLV